MISFVTFQEKKKRDKDEIGIGENSMNFGMGMAMDVDAVESASSAMLAATSKVLALSEIGMASPSSQSQFEIEIGPISSVVPAGGSLVEEPFEEIKPLVPTLYKQKPAEKQPFQKLLDHLLRVCYFKNYSFDAGHNKLSNNLIYIAKCIVIAKEGPAIFFRLASNRQNCSRIFNYN